MLHKFFTLFIVLISVSLAGNAVADDPIGVISYNVKGYINHKNPSGQQDGGWNYARNRGLLIDAINAQIKDRGYKVDFIGIVQTNEAFDGKKTPLSNITHLDSQLTKGQGPQWAGIYSNCYYDGNQIIYDDNKWSPIYSVNGGFTGCAGVVTGGNRPFLMALFQPKHQSNKKVLFISVHFPHVGVGGWIGSVANLASFKDSLTTILTKYNLKLSDVRIIMAGDMNEIGQNFYSEGRNFINMLDGKTTVGLSAPLPTCCNGGVLEFDKVYANNSIVTETYSFDINSGPNTIFEQHKGISVVLNPD